jgi:hypothetical protein
MSLSVEGFLASEVIMGFSITWFAVPEANAESFLRGLDLVDSGQTEEFPDSLICTARMDTGWQVLWYNKFECPFLDQDVVVALSKTHEILVCTVEEHCMDCAATLWRGGRRLWHLHYDGSRGPKGLDVDGDLPPCLPAIKDEMEREQLAAGGDKAGVDMIFEIPVRVAKTLTGFKHDEDSPHVVGGVFHVLARTTRATTLVPPRQGFFRRMFDR